VSNLKKQFTKKTLGLTISLLFIAYILVNRHAIFGTLKDLSIGYLIIVAIGQLGIQVFNALLMRSTLEPLGKQVGMFEAFRLTTVASFINFFTPVIGGASVRAVYLKTRHGLAYSSFISAVYANYLIIFLVSFLIGLAGLLNIPGATNNRAGKIVALFFLVGIAGSIFFMLVGHRFTNLLRRSSFRSRWARKTVHNIMLVDDGWGAIRKNPQAILFMGIWSACTMLSVVLVYWAAMKSIGLQPTLGVSVMYAALAIVGLLFNITPGSIGIRETVFAAVYSITAITAQQVVAFSLVDRTVQLLLLGAGWLLFNQAVMKKKDI
jgi:uncharacterized protein (TIRG00374 family)